MSLKSVDFALKSYLRDIYPNTEFTAESSAFTEGFTDNDLVVKLPMITLDRISTQPTQDYYNYPSIRRGGVRFENPEQTYQDRGLGVDLVYQINIWSDDRYEADDLWREVLMYFTLNQSLTVKYENSDLIKDYTMLITGNDQINDYDSFTDIGRLYRHAITIEIDGVRMVFEKSTRLVEQIPVRTITIHKNTISIIG